MSPSGVSAGKEATPKLAVIVAVDAGDAHERRPRCAASPRGRRRPRAACPGAGSGTPRRRSGPRDRSRGAPSVSAALAAASAWSPFSCPKTSLICLKWSRSQSTAESGRFDRAACATMRTRFSRRLRAFGRPVSASVAARTSATARLRRLASTGAAWLTDWSIRPCSDALSGRSCATSTEPITSPPTSDGTHVVRAVLAAEVACEQRLVVGRLCMRPAEPDREARVGRGVDELLGERAARASPASPPRAGSGCCSGSGRRSPSPRATAPGAA